MVTVDPFAIFQDLKGVAPGTRYLIFRMLLEGVVDGKGQIWRGGVARLATMAGYSAGTTSNSLRALVDMGVLLKGRELTGGRPVNTYRLSPKLMASSKRRFLGKGGRQALTSNGARFKTLSVSERCLLAQLWLTLQTNYVDMAEVDRVKACALTGVSIVSLAKDAGIGKATAQRLLAGLQQKSFILVSNPNFTADGIPGMTKTYHLLGPAVLENGMTMFRWSVTLDKSLGWLTSDVKESVIDDLVAQITRGSLDKKQLNAISTRVRCLNHPALRGYLLACICASLSNGFFWTRDVKKTPSLYSIEAALIRALRLSLESGPWHRGIESFSPHTLGSETELYKFVSVWAGDLLDKIIRLFPAYSLSRNDFPLQPEYLAWHPVVESGGVSLQVNALFFDVVDSDKFREKLERWHERLSMPTPEFLVGE